MKIYTIYYFILIAIIIYFIHYDLYNLKNQEIKKNKNSKKLDKKELDKKLIHREGFKAFDSCKKSGYPFKFCINIPFNSETIYGTWDELEQTTRY